MRPSRAGGQVLEEETCISQGSPLLAACGPIAWGRSLRLPTMRVASTPDSEGLG